MKKKYCVIGSPVAHSLSPAIHNTLYQLYGIDAEYIAREVTSGTLADFFADLPAGLQGFNVTMPLKEAVLPYLKTASVSLGGVNTVRLDSNGWHGFSTDAPGFFKSLQLAKTSFSDKNVVILGGGAVARTLIHAPEASAANSITLLNRTKAKIESLADNTHIFTGSFSDIETYMANCDLLINTTPLGMQGVGADFPDLGFLKSLPNSAFVCDLIYRPQKTRFLAAAQKLGHPTQNGLPMLIWQAFYAFEIFFGILPGADEYRKVKTALQAQL